MINFDKVNQNIKKEGLDLRLIRILYEELNELEEREILKYQGGDKMSEGKVLSYYPQNLDPLHKQKARSIFYLGA